MSEWRDATVAELCEQVDYGYTASASEDSELPRLLRITDVVGSHIDWRAVPGCEIEESRLDKFLLRVGDIVVARTGATVGHAKRIRQHPEAVFASYLVRFRPAEGVEPSFLGAVMESAAYKEWVLQNAGGAAQPNANAKTLGAYPLRVPDTPTQGRIGAILDSIDDLIDNSRRRVEVLEEMARAIYREWFVRFRYPGHEDVPLVDSPLGPIPEGWRFSRVDDLVTLNKATVDPSTVAPSTPAVGLEHIPRRRLTLDDWGEAGALGSRKATFVAGDILFGKIRPYFHKVSVAPVDGICSTDAIVLRPHAEHWGQAVLAMASDEFVAHAVQTSNGTKMPRADWKVIREFPVAMPPSEMARRFSERAHALLAHAQSLMFQARHLASLRDLLLPKLVTGQIDVSHLDLDTFTEAAIA